MPTLTVRTGRTWNNVLYMFALLAILYDKEAVTACFFRTSSPPIASGAVGTPLELDKETISIVQQTLVKTLISLGKLKFHCPQQNGTYLDKLDCRKYYNCTRGNFTVGLCETGQGYEPLARSCIPGERVALCKKVQQLPDYNCNNETGLRVYEGSCEKFILCTDDLQGAYASSCNHGDIFDPKLLLCLPEKEANCIVPSSTTEGTVHSGNQSTTNPV